MFPHIFCRYVRVTCHITSRNGFARTTRAILLFYTHVQGNALYSPPISVQKYVWTARYSYQPFFMTQGLPSPSKTTLLLPCFNPFLSLSYIRLRAETLLCLYIHTQRRCILEASGAVITTHKPAGFKMLQSCLWSPQTNRETTRHQLFIPAELKFQDDQPFQRIFLRSQHHLFS